jgi:hypothetical protein
VTSADERRRQIVVCPPVYAAGLAISPCGAGEFVSQIEFDGSRVSHDLYKFEFVIQHLVSHLDTSDCLGVVRKGHDEEADFLWLCALFRVTCCDDVPSCLVGRSLDKKDGSHLS